MLFKKEGPIKGTELKAADFVPVEDSTGETASLGEIAGLHINAQLVLDPIHKQNAVTWSRRRCHKAMWTLELKCIFEIH